eukprot:276749_1
MRMRETLFVASIMLCIVLVVPDKKDDDDEPYCKKVQVPFIETSASDYVHYFITDCVYNYWKANTSYKAMPGFKQMFGDDTYRYNASTIIEVDGERINGYKQWRAKSVASHNVISFAKGFDINIHNWSAYEVFYSYKSEVTLWSLPDTHTVVKSYVRIVFFEDGIGKYVWMNSTGSTFGGTVKKVIQATQYISSTLGYLNENDDTYYDYKYIGNPIRFIFICVFCALTVFVAASVYVLLQCSFKMRKYVPITDMDSIASSESVNNK